MELVSTCMVVLEAPFPNTSSGNTKYIVYSVLGVACI